MKCQIQSEGYKTRLDNKWPNDPFRQYRVIKQKSALKKANEINKNDNESSDNGELSNDVNQLPM